MQMQKARLVKCLKSSVSEHLWTINMLKCPKDCWNLHESYFIIFFDQSEKKSAREILFW